MSCLGVDGTAARQFIAAFYSSMAQNAERSTEAFGGRFISKSCDKDVLIHIV